MKWRSLAAAVVTVVAVALAAYGAKAESVLLPWPQMLKQPITKIGLGVYFPGNYEIIGPDSQSHIQDACVEYLRQALADAAPMIEVLDLAEIDNQVGSGSDLSIVRIYYEVMLTKWHDTSTNRDVVLGAVEIADLTPRRHSRLWERRRFPLSLLQSELDRSQLEQTIEAVVKDHIDRAIVGPLKAPILQRR